MLCIIFYFIDTASKGVTKVAAKTATASSVHLYRNDFYGPQYAIDGRFQGHYDSPKGNIFHSEIQWGPWLMVELISTVNLHSVKIYNRADCCGYRLHDVEVRAGTTQIKSKFKGRITENTLCGNFPGPGTDGSVHTITCNPTIQASVVTIQILGTHDEYLQINEVEFFQAGKFSFKWVGLGKKFVLL